MSNTADIRSRLNEFSKLMGRSVSGAVRQFAVIACRNLANTTQPFSGRDKATKASARALGEKAVEADISKVFYVPAVNGGMVKGLSERARRGKGGDKSASKLEARLNSYISSGNTRALKKILDNFGWKYLNTVDPALHQQARHGRRKKVSRKAQNMNVILNTPEHLKRYVKKRQKMVGLAKAGWATCADAIPTNQKGPATRGIPQWVTRHKGKAQGSIQDKSRDAANPRVVMTNKIPWTSQALSASAARAALSLAKRNFVEYMNKTMLAELRRRTRLAKS